jgi:hypothetical protein
MPATEQTWRNLKLLHVIFGITAIVLLVTTIAMLAADHNRPWKKYQKGFRALETWSAAARVAEENSDTYAAKTEALDKELADARRAPIEPSLLAKFLQVARTIDEDAVAADLVQTDADRLVSQSDPGERLALRGDLITRMRDITKRARFREDNLAGKLKLRKAEFDKCRADYELAVAEDAPQSRLDTLLGIAEAKQAEVVEANQVNQVANTHRKELEAVLREITASEDAAAKNVADHRNKVGQLAKTLVDRAPNPGKTLLELPVLDAFNGPLRVDQIWLPQLTLNNNFRDVARFDRCITCHKGMDKSAPGAPTEPAYREQSDVAITLPTNAEPGAPRPTVQGDGNAQLEKLYGFNLAPKGLFRDEDPTVSFVVPGSPAAVAGLTAGDVIAAVDGGKTLARSVAVSTLWSHRKPADRSNSTSAGACRSPTRPIPDSTCSSGRPVPTRCRRSDARSAIRGRGVRRASSGPPTARTTPLRPMSGTTSTDGSTTITGSSRCSRTGSSSRVASSATIKSSTSSRASGSRSLPRRSSSRVTI